MLRVAMGAWALELEGSDLKDGISSTRATGPSCEPGSDQVQTWASSLSCHVTNLRDQELDLEWRKWTKGGCSFPPSFFSLSAQFQV